MKLPINNAAAGPWKKGPAPDGKVDGEMMLFIYGPRTIVTGYWNAEKRAWLSRKLGYWDSANSTRTHSMDHDKYRYAHINPPQPEEEEGATE